MSNEIGSKIAIASGGLALLAGLGVAFAVQAADVDPYKRPNNTWISIGGTVESVRPDAFTLDYGKGFITVEMDDGDRDADGYKLVKGDTVTVNGRIDDDFYETTKIEASSVYVEKLGTYFYASPVDEEDVYFHGTMAPVVIASTVVNGTVTAVGGGEFVIDTGLRRLTVEVGGMSYDPLDDEGYQKIRKGDFVRVHGTMDARLFEGRVLEAETVVKLSS